MRECKLASCNNVGGDLAGHTWEFFFVFFLLLFEVMTSCYTSMRIRIRVQRTLVNVASSGKGMSTRVGYNNDHYNY